MSGMKIHVRLKGLQLKTELSQRCMGETDAFVFSCFEFDAAMLFVSYNLLSETAC